MKKLLAAILALCLCTAAHAELPTVRSWCHNWPLDWQIDLVSQGYPYVPVVKLFPPRATKGFEDRRIEKEKNRILVCEKPELVTALDLRYDDIPYNFTAEYYRQMPQAESPLIWFAKDGAPNSAPIADTLGPIALWSSDGRDTGDVPFLRGLPVTFPNLKRLMFADNNEKGVDKDSRYKNLPLADMDTASYRMTQWLTDKGVESLAAALPEWQQLKRDKYAAWFDAFCGTFPERLRDIRLVQYGAPKECFAGSPCSAALYLGDRDLLTDPKAVKGLPAILTLLPTWEALEKDNPKAVREVAFSLSPKAIEGPDYTITPEVFKGLCGAGLWLMKGRDTPVSLRAWFDSKLRPESPLGAATYGDYMVAACKAAKGVEAYAEFWEEGEPLGLLACEENDATTTRVWATGARIKDRYLIVAFSPLATENGVNVTLPDGTVVCANHPGPLSYTLIDLTPAPPPKPEPKVVRKYRARVSAPDENGVSVIEELED